MTGAFGRFASSFNARGRQVSSGPRGGGGGNARKRQNRVVRCPRGPVEMIMKQPRIIRRWSGKRGSNSRPLPWQGSVLIPYSGRAETRLETSTHPQFPRRPTLVPRASTPTRKGGLGQALELTGLRRDGSPRRSLRGRDCERLTTQWKLPRVGGSGTSARENSRPAAQTGRQPVADGPLQGSLTGYEAWRRPAGDQEVSPAPADFRRSVRYRDTPEYPSSSGRAVRFA